MITMITMTILVIMIKNDAFMTNVNIKCRSLILSHEDFFKSKKNRKKKARGTTICHTCRQK